MQLNKWTQHWIHPLYLGLSARHNTGFVGKNSCNKATVLKYVCMYVCMYVWSSHVARVRINRVRYCPSCSWSGEQAKLNVSLSRSRLRIWSRETGSAVPSRVSLLIFHTQAESGVYLQESSRVPRRRLFIYLNRHTPSDQSRVYRVTQLRPDCVHCRESAGTGPVNLKVVQNGCCLDRSPWTI